MVMKLFKNIAFTFLLLFVMASFSQCSSTKKLQSNAPMTIGKVYYQGWIAGVKGGGSGTNIFIPITNTNVVPDSVYFRGRVAKLTTKFQDTTLYIGRFNSPDNQKHDIVMSSDSAQEYGNKMPEKRKEIPFVLKDDECVISYKEGNKIKYYKITNVTKKDMKHYPMSREN